MKVINKIMILSMVTLLPMGFTGCSDDDKPGFADEERTPDFVLEQDSIKVKIGSENKVTLNIKQGGGEYNAFSLDKDIAKVEVVNEAIVVEGLANGRTSLIISDKYNRYRRVPMSIYTTDVLELSLKEIKLETRLGSSDTATVQVILGNDGYKVTSNNPAVLVSVTKNGKISITATSKKTDYTAEITVTDNANLSENITVFMKTIFKPFTNEELEAIIKDNTTRYFHMSSNTFYSKYNYRPLNEMLDNGKHRYGWDYGGYYWLYLDFKGGKNVGVKNEAQYTYNSWHGKIVKPIVLEIIKNDGTTIWGIFSYINDEEEKMYTGYFCNAV